MSKSHDILKIILIIFSILTRPDISRSFLIKKNNVCLRNQKRCDVEERLINTSLALLES